MPLAMPLAMPEKNDTLYGKLSNVLFSIQKVILLFHVKTQTSTIYHLMVFIVRSVQLICSTKKNLLRFLIFCIILYQTAWGRPIIDFMLWILNYAYKHGFNVGVEDWVVKQKEIMIDMLHEGAEMAKTCLLNIILGFIGHAQVRNMLDSAVSKSTEAAVVTALQSVQGQNAIQMALASSAVGSTLNLVYHQNQNLLTYTETAQTLHDVATKTDLKYLLEIIEEKYTNDQMLTLLKTMQKSIKTTEMQKLLEMVAPLAGYTINEIMTFTDSFKSRRITGGTKKKRL